MPIHSSMPPNYYRLLVREMYYTLIQQEPIFHEYTRSYMKDVDLKKINAKHFSKRMVEQRKQLVKHLSFRTMHMKAIKGDLQSLMQNVNFTEEEALKLTYELSDLLVSLDLIQPNLDAEAFEDEFKTARTQLKEFADHVHALQFPNKPEAKSSAKLFDNSSLDSREKESIVKFTAERQNTHRAEVHTSTAASLLRLEKRYQNHKYSSIPYWLEEMVIKRMILGDLKEELKLKNLSLSEYSAIEDLITKTVLKTYSSTIDEYSGRTMPESLAYSYLGIIDEHAMKDQKLTENDIALRKTSFFKELYILAKEYSGSDELSKNMQRIHGTPEACFGGLFNGFIATLEAKHDDVIIVRDVTFLKSLKLESAIIEYIENLSQTELKRLKADYSKLDPRLEQPESENIRAIHDYVRKALKKFSDTASEGANREMLSKRDIEELVQTIQYHPRLSQTEKSVSVHKKAVVKKQESQKRKIADERKININENVSNLGKSRRKTDL